MMMDYNDDHGGNDDDYGNDDETHRSVSMLSLTMTAVP